MNFKIANVQFTLSYPLVAGITLILVCDTTGIALCSLLACFCHEMGHISAMKLTGTKITEIHISIFEVGIVDISQKNRGIIAEMTITLSGIFVNFLLFFLSLIVYNKSKLSLFGYFATANLTLGLFNLLPIETLDGGNALKLILQRNFTDRTVYIVTLVVSLLLIIPLGYFSYTSLMHSRYNFTMLFATLYLTGAVIFKMIVP
ncbi:MAG: site-2 protease family protein [Clostridia bacterium]|nr:site-2 protease family protein [Clostridia bacterium]